MTAARHSVEIDVSPERVYDLLIDFPSYPSFVPNQVSARILDTGTDTWRVEFQLSVAKRLTYTLDLVGIPGRSLRWSHVSGDMVSENQGGWTLEPTDGGGTRATYEIDVALQGFVPRSVSRLLIERTLPANVRAFKLEAERRG